MIFCCTSSIHLSARDACDYYYIKINIEIPHSVIVIMSLNVCVSIESDIICNTFANR